MQEIQEKEKENMNCPTCNKRNNYVKSWRKDHPNYENSEKRKAYKKEWEKRKKIKEKEKSSSVKIFNYPH